jgi:hypothetical protein
MEMIDEILSDEVKSVGNCSKNTASSTDLSEMLQYQGNASFSYRSPTARNVATHQRQPCSPSSLKIPTINNAEEDLLDEFFNTVQEIVCQQHEMEGQGITTGKSPKSPHSLMSGGSVKYEKDIIDFVFENVENVTCNKPSNATLSSTVDHDPTTLHDTLEKLQTIGKSVHLKLYRKDPESIQKRVDEWFADKFQTKLPDLEPEAEAPRDEIEVEREKSSDFLEVFFQRMERVVCIKLPLDKTIKMDQQPQDEKDMLDAVFETVESAVCESDEVSSAYPLQRSERSQRSTVTASNHSSRSRSALLLSPQSVASTSFGGTPRSLASESEYSRTSHTGTSSVGTYSYSEHSSRFTYNVMSPRSERSERTEGSESCLSPRTEASYTEHTRRSVSHSGHSSHTEERDNRTLLSASSSQEEDDDGDESTAFDVVSRPLFVIKEEVSATESMISELKRKERLLQRQKNGQDESVAGCGPQTLPFYSHFRKTPIKKYSFRYSSAHYKFQKKSCTPDAAAHTAQDWLERFKYAVEVTAYRLTAAISGMDPDELCSVSEQNKEDEKEKVPYTIEDESKVEPSPFEKWSTAFDQVHERVSSKNVAIMCNGPNDVDDRDDIDIRDIDFASATQNTSLFGMMDRTRFASASLMPSFDEDEHADADSYESYGRHHSRSFDEPRKQQEPPEHKETPASKPSIQRKRGRDPEPSFQLKLDSDAIVGSLRNYASCTPRDIDDHFEKPKHHEGIRSPRSSETAKTAELTATSSSVIFVDEEEEHDVDTDNISTAAHISVKDMVVSYPDQRKPDRGLQTKNTTDSSTAFFDTKQDSPKAAPKESSSHSSKTKEATFHTAKVFSIFDEDEGTIFTHDNDEGTCFSYPSEMDIQRTCTDIVVYEKKPDFIRLWFGKDAKYPASPWQLVVYVAWLSVSFLVRVNGEVNSHLAERKRALQAILEDEELSYTLSRGLSRDSLDAVPSIDYQISLE